MVNDSRPVFLKLWYLSESLGAHKLWVPSPELMIL